MKKFVSLFVMALVAVAAFSQSYSFKSADKNPCTVTLKGDFVVIEETLFGGYINRITIPKSKFTLTSGKVSSEEGGKSVINNQPHMEASDTIYIMEDQKNPSMVGTFRAWRSIRASRLWESGCIKKTSRLLRRNWDCDFKLIFFGEDTMTELELTTALKSRKTQEILGSIASLSQFYRDALLSVLEENIVPKVKKHAESKGLVAKCWQAENELRGEPKLYFLAFRRESWEKMGIFFSIQLPWLYEIEDEDYVVDSWVKQEVEFGVRIRGSDVVVSDETAKKVRNELDFLGHNSAQNSEVWIWKAEEDDCPSICTENIEEVIAFFKGKVELFLSALDGIEGL